MLTKALCRTRSIDTASAIAPALCKTPTVLSIFTSSIPRRQTINPIGYPRPRARSFSGCARIFPVNLFLMAHTRCHRSLKHDDITHKAQASHHVWLGHVCDVGGRHVPSHLLLAAPHLQPL